MTKSPVVLIAPLDWGLGHATRCIPLIRAFQELDFKVILAGEKNQKALLEKEFPDLQFLELRGYHMTYSSCSFLILFKIVFQIPGILLSIYKEHRWLNSIIDDFSLDLIVSDNRYGLFCSRVPCIFMTHQLYIKTPRNIGRSLLRRLNFSFINQFNRCWVPDMATDGLAGSLSHPSILPEIPTFYIGLLSRFQSPPKSNDFKFDFVVLLSGPEPQRTILEKKLRSGLSALSGYKVAMVLGLPMLSDDEKLEDGMVVYPHLSGALLEELISSAKVVISRSGYTTLMELSAMRKKVLMIPTPGQTEQVYLAEKIAQSGKGLMLDQAHASWERIIQLTANQHMDALPHSKIFHSCDLPSLLPDFNIIT